MLIATQNPFEFEGTYYLPENQLDRFLLRVDLGYPDESAEHRDPDDAARPQRAGRAEAGDAPRRRSSHCRIACRRSRIDRAIVEYILDLVEATRHDEQLHLGVSPRGALALTQASQASAVAATAAIMSCRMTSSTSFIPVCRAPRRQQDLPQQRRRQRDGADHCRTSSIRSLLSPSNSQL